MAENLKQFEDQINQAKGVIKKLEDKILVYTFLPWTPKATQQLVLLTFTNT